MLARAASAGIVALALPALAVAGDRAPTPNIFAPGSTPAFAIRDVGFFVLGITAVVFVIVAGLTRYAIVRYRHRGTAPGSELCLRLQRWGGVRGWGRDGPGTGA